MTLNALLLIPSLVGASPQTGDGLAKLNFLLGKWESKETIHMTGGDPISFTLQGTYAQALNQSAIVADESFEAMGQKIANHLVFKYEATAKKYKLWWFSNTLADPMTFTGEASGASFVFESTPGSVGFTKQPHRITYTPTADGKFDAKLEVQYGKDWQLMTSAKYSRK